MKARLLSGLFALVIFLISCSPAPAATPAPTQVPSSTPPAPIIEAFLPGDSAPAGAIVSISGQNLGSSGRVEFGEYECPATKWSQTNIQVKLPLELPPGQLQVAVTANGRRSEASQFTILAPTLASVGLRSEIPAYGYEPVFADLDSDGDLDMFSPVSFAESGVDSAYHLNNGDGTFSEVELASAGLPVQANTYKVVISDLDGDGDHDLYAVGAKESFYALNNGDGTFATQNLAQTGLQMRTDQIECFDVVTADFDMDGHPDLFAGCGRRR
jgi:hypothetical protein